MSRFMRSESGNFHVIPQQVRILRHAIDLAAEKLLLKIKAWSPSQIAAHFQIFAQAMAHHVRWRDPLRRLGIMSTARGMDVMISGPPAQFGRIDPALHLE